ncbi:GNAT family N-acetyltransferase [Colwellia sp. 6_MG-2023]|uniref:GNAT family N-acetyltransferase n=1 Tax=Colwellia sp. 6_MG-2023 TaxID=3062676 RepID=UPI0026E3C942|nr:GNAT family N-acetyltransferase [Colwellia sp. 6_MG-2023]MDO6489119.1 GNAT family N-acetyltransferase [Colwellia sp. 6_MG-2023]
MEVSLHPVTKENYERVCDLEVSKEQEEFVSENTWSLVESFYEEYVTRAICSDGEVVGFFMWVQETSNTISIWRFMIDKQFQNQGLGRRALHLALNEIKKVKDLKEIEISYSPQNPVAKNFYSSFGFKEVGMDEDNDDMLAIISI